MRWRLAFIICPDLRNEIVALRSGNTKLVLENQRLLDELFPDQISQIISMPRELTDEQADAALRATAVWIDVKGSQLTVNREKMKKRYQSLVKFIDASNSRKHTGNSGEEKCK